MNFLKLMALLAIWHFGGTSNTASCLSDIPDQDVLPASVMEEVAESTPGGSAETQLGAAGAAHKTLKTTKGKARRGTVTKKKKVVNIETNDKLINWTI